MVLVVLLLAGACSSSTDSETATATPTPTSSPTLTSTPTPTPSPTAPASPTSTSTPDPTPEPQCPAPQPTDGELEEVTIEHGGYDRYYRIKTPVTDGTEPLPVVFDFHGITATKESQAQMSRYEELAVERGYIVVALDGSRDPTDPEGLQAWHLRQTENPDVDFSVAVLDEVEERFCVDTDRVYVSGMSNGAGISVLAVCLRPDRFAMSGPVAGMNLASCSDGGEGMVAVHGDADPSAGFAPVGESPGVVGAMANLAGNGGCDPEPIVDHPFEDIEVLAWTGCDDGAEFAVYIVLGGGHTWPGRNLVEFYGEEVLRQAAVDRGLPPNTYVDLLGNVSNSIDASIVILDGFDRHGARVASMKSAESTS